MEPDCYWATHAGYELEMITEKYGNRVMSLHVKDMKEENGERRSIETGLVTLDIKGHIQQGNGYGVNWFVVEQGQFDGEPMVSPKVNMDNLNKLNNKRLFIKDCCF